MYCAFLQLQLMRMRGLKVTPTASTLEGCGLQLMRMRGLKVVCHSYGRETAQLQLMRMRGLKVNKPHPHRHWKTYNRQPPDFRPAVLFCNTDKLQFIVLSRYAIVGAGALDGPPKIGTIFGFPGEK